MRRNMHRAVAGGVVHSFDGSQPELAQYLDLGLHIGMRWFVWALAMCLRSLVSTSYVCQASMAALSRRKRTWRLCVTFPWIAYCWKQACSPRGVPRLSVFPCVSSCRRALVRDPGLPRRLQTRPHKLEVCEEGKVCEGGHRERSHGAVPHRV